MGDEEIFMMRSFDLVTMSMKAQVNITQFMTKMYADIHFLC